MFLSRFVLLCTLLLASCEPGADAELEFVDLSLEELGYIEDLGSERAFARRQATRVLTERSRGNAELRAALRGHLGSPDPEVRARVLRILQDSQATVSWAKAHRLLADHVFGGGPAESLLEEAERVQAALRSLAGFHQMVCDQIGDVARRQGTRERCRLPGGGFVPPFFDAHDRELLALYKKQGEAVQRALVETGIEPVFISGYSSVFSYWRGEELFLMRLDVAGNAELFRPIHDTTRAKSYEWRLEDVLPLDTSIPSRADVSRLPPLVGNPRVTWSWGDQTRRLEIQVPGLRLDSQAPDVISQYLATLSPGDAETIYRVVDVTP